MKPDLEKLKALAERATKEPWDVYFETGIDPFICTYAEDAKGNRSLKDCVVPGYKVKLEHMNEIVASRRALPQLLDLCEAQEKKIDALEDERDGIIDCIKATEDLNKKMQAVVAAAKKVDSTLRIMSEQAPSEIFKDCVRGYFILGHDDVKLRKALQALEVEGE